MKLKKKSFPVPPYPSFSVRASMCLCVFGLKVLRSKYVRQVSTEVVENLKDIEENKDKDKKEKELTKEISLLREEVSEEFTEIFKEVWTRVKKEAD